MILFFYNLGLATALLLGAPWWLWKMATTHKYRQGMLERLGRVPARLRRSGLMPRIDTRPVLWLHAVSVGEVLAVSRLAGELDRAFPEFRLLHLDHHAHRAGAGPAALRRGARLLLPARSALGGERVP